MQVKKNFGILNSLNCKCKTSIRVFSVCTQRACSFYHSKLRTTLYAACTPLLTVLRMQKADNRNNNTKNSHLENFCDAHLRSKQVNKCANDVTTNLKKIITIAILCRTSLWKTWFWKHSIAYRYEYIYIIINNTFEIKGKCRKLFNVLC